MNNKHNFDYTEPLYLPSVYYSLLCSEAGLLRGAYEKLFWKYAANLQKNTQAEVWFKSSCCVSTWKSHFDTDVLLYICCIF